jgi:hypothetical protein
LIFLRKAGGRRIKRHRLETSTMSLRIGRPTRLPLPVGFQVISLS